MDIFYLVLRVEGRTLVKDKSITRLISTSSMHLVCSVTRWFWSTWIEFCAVLTNAIIVCQLVHIISIWDADGNRMNFIWNVLNWKRDLVIEKLDFTGLVKHTLKREATSWKLNEHVIYTGTQFSPYSSLSRRASALEMVHRAANSSSVIKALGFFRVSPIFPKSWSDEKILGTESLFQFFKVFISYQLNICMLPEFKVIVCLPSGWLSTITSDHCTTNSVP